MKTTVKRESTRFYVTQSDYEELVSFPSASLIIQCLPNKNKHPKGQYDIPNRKAREFIESKQGTHNWNSHKNFKQDSIPTGLEKYFFVSMNLDQKAEAKLTEDEVVEILMQHLVSQSWTIESFCLGQQQGYDIVANRKGKHLYVEVKGAKANDNSPTKKRKFFDSGQIKDHFGKALVKSLETKIKYPNALVAIAHPEDKDIRKTIGSTVTFLKKIGIMHFWVGKQSIKLIE